VPIRSMVGKTARSRRRNTRGREREAAREREEVREQGEGRGGEKDELHSVRENPTVEKEEVAAWTRDEESERTREKETRTRRERRGKTTGAFEKVLSCRRTRPLRRYRTPVRCCWPRRGRAASSATSC